MLVAGESTRIEDVICFQEPLIRSSKLGFPEHMESFWAYNTKIIYKFIVDARAAARSRKKENILNNIKSNF